MHDNAFKFPNSRYISLYKCTYYYYYYYLANCECRN